MFVQKWDPARLADGYDIKCYQFYPWEGVVNTPFGAGWAVVEPGMSTKHHNHQEGETFIVARGRGRMRVGDEVTELAAGDVVFQPPFKAHTFENTSDTEPLVFVSIYWEDTRLWAGRKDPAVAGERPRRVMVTAAPPTPNGDLHLGHLSGPYLAADVHTRYLKLRGVDAHYCCGTDDHFSFVKTRAEQAGLAPRDSADRLAADIRRSLEAAEIDLALYVRPHGTPTYARLVEAFFRKLHDEGKLVEKEVASPYCEHCRLYLYEAHVRGGCPHCGAQASGFCCEECSWPIDGDLIDPVCTHCGDRAAERRFRRLFFPLSRYERQLKEHFLKAGMNAHLRTFVKRVLAAGAPDVPATHVADWGFPVPVPGYEGQVISVWFETAPRYLAYAQDLAAKLGLEGGWERYWKDSDAEVVQFFGCDNAFLYALYIPALLLAFDPEVRPAAAFVMNEFYRLDDLKFSTTRKHAVWVRELLSEVPADPVRYHLARTRPETESTNFSLAELEETVARELIGTWQAWLAALAAKVAEERGGEVPWTGDWTEEHRRFYQRVEELIAQAAAAYEARTFSPQLATRAMEDLVRAARRFGKGEDHWQGVPGHTEERRTGIALEVMAAKVLALMTAPVMPEFAARLWHALGFDTPLAEARWEERPSWVPGGQKLRNLGGPYFEPVRVSAKEPVEAGVAGSPA